MRCAGIAGRDKHNQTLVSSIAKRKLTQTNMTLGRAFHRFGSTSMRYRNSNLPCDNRVFCICKHRLTHHIIMTVLWGMQELLWRQQEKLQGCASTDTAVLRIVSSRCPRQRWKLANVGSLRATREASERIGNRPATSWLGSCAMPYCQHVTFFATSIRNKYEMCQEGHA